MDHPSTRFAQLLSDLLARGYVPVVACIGATRDGQVLNVNADTLASHLAVQLGARRLVIAGGTAGVLDAEGQTIARLSARDAARLIRTGTANKGMVAKLEACRAALRKGVRKCSSPERPRCAPRRARQRPATCRAARRWCDDVTSTTSGTANRVTAPDVQAAAVAIGVPRREAVRSRTAAVSRLRVGIGDLARARHPASRRRCDQAAPLLQHVEPVYHPFKAMRRAGWHSCRPAAHGFLTNRGTEA